MNGTTANEQLMELNLKEFENRFAEKMEDLMKHFSQLSGDKTTLRDL